MSVRAKMTDSPAWKAARPAVSVLIPFLRDDPAELLGLLDEEAASVDGAVEIVVLDDGTRDAALTARLAGQVKAMALPVRLITLPSNEGRSIGRNRLASAARGGSLLFLDSDMRPDHRRFLRDWADLAAREDPAVAFGGFSLLQAPTDARFAVHRAMAAKSECVPWTERARQPEKYVYTSNLLVRRDVFESGPSTPASPAGVGRMWNGPCACRAGSGSSTSTTPPPIWDSTPLRPSPENMSSRPRTLAVWPVVTRRSSPPIRATRRPGC